MKYDGLIKAKKIKPQKAEEGEIAELFTLAERDLETAQFTMSHDWDWAFAIAYNSVLQACRAFMLKEGYRARSEEAHKITFEFMQLALKKEEAVLIGYFDRCRIMRHKTIYQVSGSVTETEVKQLIENGRAFVKKLKKLCRI